MPRCTDPGISGAQKGFEFGGPLGYGGGFGGDDLSSHGSEAFKVEAVIIYKEGFWGVQAEIAQDSPVGFGMGFSPQSHAPEIPDAGKEVSKSQGGEGAFGMLQGGIGEKGIVRGEGGDVSMQGGIGNEVSVRIGGMDSLDVGFGIFKTVADAQPLEGGAYAGRPGAAAEAGFVMIDIEIAGREVDDATVYFIHEAAGRGIEGIIEIEKNEGLSHGTQLS